MSFYLSKILWLIINPLNIILSFIFAGFIFNFFSKSFVAKILYYLALTFFVLVAVLPIGKFMIYKLEEKFHNQDFLPDQIDGILILSGATNVELSKDYNQINLNGSVERLTESIQLIKKYSDSKIIFSGGSGSIYNQKLTHSKVANLFFKRFEIRFDNIIYEDKSRNTYENILFSKKIANPKINENWLIVTSASHMPRALNIAEKLEWTFIPFAVDFKMSKKFSWKPTINFLGNITTFQIASHEWIGLLSYYWMGRSSKVL